MGRVNLAARSSACVALTVVLLATRALAQTKPNLPAAEKPPANDQIRIVTNEITVPVTVTDKTGEFVLDLVQKDFHVYDDGAPQTIDHWELGGDPLAVALLIETSSRIHAYIPIIHDMGSTFTQTVMALDGEASVITYDSNVKVRQPFTTDHDAIAKAIGETKFEAPEMSLYDGMAKAVQLLSAQSATWRRIMLIVGESQDDASTAKLAPVLRDAEHANISIYVIGPSSTAADVRRLSDVPIPLKLPHLPPITSDEPCIQRLPGGGGVPCINLATPALWLLERGTDEIKHHELEVAAAATGGIDYRAMRNSALLEALDRIGSELHAQYVLTYRPNAPRSIGYHSIDVVVSRPKLTVRARPAYYFGPPQN
ncbi:MAG TPA: VWA domain-containing protein [Candidatus Acidoferrum sp.]|nr:VWA domain-containing protein [Candidatus Acidoferrum sp.]